MAASFVDRSISLCRQAGFQRIFLRGDSDSLSPNSSAGRRRRWAFVLSSASAPVRTWLSWPRNYRSRLSASWSVPNPRSIKTVLRQQPERDKPRVVQDRGFKTIHTLNEMVAEVSYRPTVCEQAYRVVVLRKHLAMDERQRRLFEENRYFSFITNDC